MKHPATFITSPKERHHRMLFDDQLPFKHNRTIKQKNKYQRKPKYGMLYTEQDHQ